MFGSTQGNLLDSANCVCNVRNQIIQNMYGKLNERRLNESDFVMSCEKARDELSEYINQQAKRVNIDSAKKRAVVQHMDYEGFRQMVLGANIFPTKSKELYNFTKGESANIPTNLKEEGENPSKEKAGKKQEQLLMENIKGKSEFHCNNFRQFKKKLNQNYSPQLDDLSAQHCYNLVKQQNQERLRKIFTPECEPNILLKLSHVFEHVLSKMVADQNQTVEAEASYMVMFLATLVNIQTMRELTLGVLSKKQKQSIVNLLGRLKALTKEESWGQIDKIHQIIVK